MAARPYRVWCPDRGQTEDDARLITALTAIGAACDFAQDHAGFHGDPFEEIEVKVRLAGEHGACTVLVTVEVVPSFHGAIIDSEREAAHG